MFMVGHIFDRSVGNLKPTIIFIWPWSRNAVVNEHVFFDVATVFPKLVHCISITDLTFKIIENNSQ